MEQVLGKEQVLGMEQVVRRLGMKQVVSEVSTGRLGAGKWSLFCLITTGCW